MDQTVGDHLSAAVPALGAEKTRITIRQLLTMTSGLPWRELNSVEQDYFAFVNSPDPLLWILNRPLEHPPGEVWNYNTGACHILSAILTEAAGASARAFALAHLFGPLDEEAGPWLTDNRGYCFGGHGASLRARTMIKLGRLFLDAGTWQGSLVVSQGWVRESTAWHRDTGWRDSLRIAAFSSSLRSARASLAASAASACVTSFRARSVIPLPSS